MLSASSAMLQIPIISRERAGIAIEPKPTLCMHDTALVLSPLVGLGAIWFKSMDQKGRVSPVSHTRRRGRLAPP